MCRNIFAVAITAVGLGAPATLAGPVDISDLVNANLKMRAITTRMWAFIRQAGAW